MQCRRPTQKLMQQERWRKLVALSGIREAHATWIVEPPETNVSEYFIPQQLHFYLSNWELHRNGFLTKANKSEKNVKAFVVLCSFCRACRVQMFHKMRILFDVFVHKFETVIGEHLQSTTRKIYKTNVWHGKSSKCGVRICVFWTQHADSWLLSPADRFLPGFVRRRRLSKLSGPLLQRRTFSKEENNFPKKDCAEEKVHRGLIPHGTQNIPSLMSSDSIQKTQLLICQKSELWSHNR